MVNVYDRNLQAWRNPRAAHQANWPEIMSAPRVIVAGDMNAHSPMWNGRAVALRNRAFWENLIETHGMTIYNSKKPPEVEPTRSATPSSISPCPKAT